MADDILEPVALYQTVLKDAHAQRVSALFEDLVRRSGVDEGANVRTVGEVRVLEAQLEDTTSSGRWWRVLRGAVLLGAAACLLGAFTHSAHAAVAVAYAAGALAGGALVLWQLNPRIQGADARGAALKARLDAKRQEAFQQMAPLNRLYHWGMFAELVGQTMPQLTLDPYFSNGRLDELRHGFGWNDQLTEKSSLLFSHSGALNGNPLVIGRKLDHHMGTKTYSGSLTIHWTVTVKGSDGVSRRVSRSETLRASVDKPFPRYHEDTFVIYGNEAAPELQFTRKPSSLSGLGDDTISGWRKAWATKSLESKARDMKSGFTLMANREFETLFGASDRNHEVQFRLLFTALAQQEMVKLLTDKTVGYGDTCTFVKGRMINVVQPSHMAQTDISSDPANFRAYDLRQARQFFNTYQNDLFRAVFFGLAPLLVIPLYQQHRSHADIYGEALQRNSSFWEHESIANYFGEKRFQHAQCITRSILKTRAESSPDGTHLVTVSAFGYAGRDRVDYVRMSGGDGNYHNVPVPWVEYIPVRHDSQLVLHDLERPGSPAEAAPAADWRAAFQGYGVNPEQAVLRRSIVAALR